VEKMIKQRSDQRTLWGSDSIGDLIDSQRRKVGWEEFLEAERKILLQGYSASFWRNWEKGEEVFCLAFSEELSKSQFSIVLSGIWWDDSDASEKENPIFYNLLHKKIGIIFFEKPSFDFEIKAFEARTIRLKAELYDPYRQLLYCKEVAFWGQKLLSQNISFDISLTTERLYCISSPQYDNLMTFSERNDYLREEEKSKIIMIKRLLDDLNLQIRHLEELREDMRRVVPEEEVFAYNTSSDLQSFPGVFGVPEMSLDSGASDASMLYKEGYRIWEEKKDENIRIISLLDPTGWISRWKIVSWDITSVVLKKKTGISPEDIETLIEMSRGERPVNKYNKVEVKIKI
jgi:hypothetical protein